MSWLLSVMALDVVDEAVMNAKVVCALPVYSSTVTVSPFLSIERDTKAVEAQEREVRGVVVDTDVMRYESCVFQ